MKTKQILALVLLVFVAVSIVYMAFKEQSTTTATDKTTSSVNREKGQLVVYYFHGDVRCVTCHNLEAYTKEALERYFADGLTSEDITWKPVNVDKPENKHYVRDYKLVSKAVVLSWVVKGKEIRWKNLDQIWQKVNNKEDYLEYIRQGVEEFLEGGV